MAGRTRAYYSPEQKAAVYKMFDDGVSTAEINKKTDIPETTIQKWKADRSIEEAANAEQSVVEQLKSSELENRLLKITNKFVIRYAKATEGVAKAEVEIAHLLEVIEIFTEGNWPVKRLSELSEEDDA